jgi:outer membrane protein OmpA-like peptidoglycan-associated protein
MLRSSLAANRTRNPGIFAPWVALVLLVLPTAANAVDVSLKLEPAVAIPLSAPQSERFAVGGGESLKLLVGVTPWLDIGPTASFHFLPPGESFDESGVIWGFGGGLRLKRSHDAESLGGVSPWLDADAFFIRTGPLNRPGFDAAVGLAVPVGESRAFWVGPFVRYLHVGQPETAAGFDNHDSKTLTVGLSMEVGAGRKREPVPEVVAAAAVQPVEVVPCPECEKSVSCADGDKDGMPDSVDRCPDVVGTLDDYGCPAYKKVVVGKDRLELKEKLFFDLDRSTLKAASFPVLDDVVLALKDNKSFLVQVEGHTDSSGSVAHNQTLSEQRAATVLEYLVAHGVPKDRLVSKGFASSVPIDTNDTLNGRENNRRVEFVVSSIASKDGSAK